MKLFKKKKKKKKKRGEVILIENKAMLGVHSFMLPSQIKASDNSSMAVIHTHRDAFKNILLHIYLWYVIP